MHKKSATVQGDSRPSQDIRRSGIDSQLFRFCIVGCLNFAISYSVFLLLYRCRPLSALLPGIAPIDGAAANVAGFAAGMANSFAWNRHWTFKVLEAAGSQARKFVVTNIVTLVISTATIFVCIDLWHWSYKPVWVITMAFVTMLNFSASKYWVFSSDAARRAGSET